MARHVVGIYLFLELNGKHLKCSCAKSKIVKSYMFSGEKIVLVFWIYLITSFDIVVVLYCRFHPLACPLLYANMAENTCIDLIG